MTYRFDTVWNACTPALSEEIIAFWTSENALPAEDDPAERTGQTVVVARDSDGRIAGTCTAYLRVVPRLGQPMYYFRMFFSGGHRRRYSIIPMMKEAQKALSAFNSGLPAAGIAGCGHGGRERQSKAPHKPDMAGRIQFHRLLAAQPAFVCLLLSGCQAAAASQASDRLKSIQARTGRHIRERISMPYQYQTVWKNVNPELSRRNHCILDQ